ncbi:MAG: hypothetical protein WCC90_22815, partial [Methylocella sp.]
MADPYVKLIRPADQTNTTSPYEPFLRKHLAGGVMGISVLLSIGGTAMAADPVQAPLFSERLNSLRTA